MIADELISVSANVFREGHDLLGADVILISPDGKEISRKVMKSIWEGGDRFSANLRVPHEGDFLFTIESYDHPLATWLHDAQIKIEADVDAELMCTSGAQLYRELIANSPAGKDFLSTALLALQDKNLTPLERFKAATADPVRVFIEENPLRRLATRTQLFPIRADYPRALVGSWYEFFPRSEGATLNADGTISSGTFLTAAKRLPAVAAMGFDILYLPPIHPIGLSHRKGRNNTLTPAPSDPGVPWAIGGSEGGHLSINPELGTMRDFESFVKSAKKNEIAIALDFALQASPDHPWVNEHPEFFIQRADGSIAYAENPPKKYQDIYPINFDNDYEAILDESVKVLRFWISKGVELFRVDNPHTKPLHFWSDLLKVIHLESPGVVFLAEAFTKPVMMHALGMVGFHQSYTYFTWRTSKEELMDYGNEVAHQSSAFFRPNFWVNTPDILPHHLQTGNPAIFAIRATLAATLSPSWGMYAGFELYEHRALREGGEEYIDSEKYEIKIRDWDGAATKQVTLAPFITVLNKIRRDNVALQRLRNLQFHHCENSQIIAFSKRERDNLILVVVNLDPNFAQETTVNWNLNHLGITAETFEVVDLIDGKKYQWGSQTYIRLDPTRLSGKVVHIARVKL